MIEIQLTKGQVTVVSDEDAELAELRWHASFDPGYADKGSYMARRSVRSKTLRLHRVILERVLGRSLEKGEEVDHIDGDTLNNTRGNLRLSTRSKNMGNTRSRGGSSRFKGVTWRKRDQCWAASCFFEGKRYHLGHFDDELIAARVYDAFARQHFGEFARLNFADGNAWTVHAIEKVG